MTLATAAGWVGTSAWRPSEVKSWVTVISFLVRVPVLSEQMTLQQPEEGNGVTSNQCGPPGHVTGGAAGGAAVSPSVSTMGSLLTMALFCTILITPSASVTVTTMGSPSGMAATARLEETRGGGG